MCIINKVQLENFLKNIPFHWMFIEILTTTGTIRIIAKKTTGKYGKNETIIDIENLIDYYCNLNCKSEIINKKFIYKPVNSDLKEKGITMIKEYTDLVIDKDYDNLPELSNPALSFCNKSKFTDIIITGKNITDKEKLEILDILTNKSYTMNLRKSITLSNKKHLSIVFTVEEYRIKLRENNEYQFLQYTTQCTIRKGIIEWKIWKTFL